MVDEQMIVVGVDGSPGSIRALQWAMETGAQYEVEVEAVSVGSSLRLMLRSREGRRSCLAWPVRMSA